MMSTFSWLVALSLIVVAVSPAAVNAQEPANLPPTAQAGADQVVEPGSLVTLNGSQSRDPEEAPLTYSWRQLDGPRAVLDSPRGVTFPFTSGTGGEVYLFALTVRDDSGGVGTDTVVVATRKPAPAPIAAQAFTPSSDIVAEGLGILRRSLQLINTLLFATSLLATVLTVLDRLPRFVGSTGVSLPFRQFIGRRFRRASWLVLIAGALLNSVLLWWFIQWRYFIFGAAYVVFLLLKVLLEARLRPSHGLVRDAITHVPVDLAVVRLYDEASGRLVLTRATDDHGRFFLLPPAGTYRGEVLKQGYAPFVKEHVSVSGMSDAAVYLKAMLMPSAPYGLLPTANSQTRTAQRPLNQVFGAPVPRDQATR